MSLLSDEKIEQLFKSMHGFPYPNDLYAFARAIEAAVLEAQKQKPWPFSADRVTYHKAAPVVQPGMVMVPQREYDDLLEMKAMYEGLCK